MSSKIHSASWTVVIAVLMAGSAAAAPCPGSRRLQLSISGKNGAGLMNLSLTQCAPPSPCTQPIAAPLTVTVRDAAGRTAGGRVRCGKGCLHAAAPGCTAGTELIRSRRTAVRYDFSGTGTSIGAGKIRLHAQPAAAALTPPLTVSITDGTGYSVAAEFANCQVRSAGTTVHIGCNERR